MSDPKNNDKYQRILQAAVQVFSKNGFFNSKVSEIAKSANVADGTIYLYFKNKDDILISLFEDQMKQVFTYLNKRLEGVDDPIQGIRGFIHAHFEMVQENPEMAQVITVEVRQSAQFMNEYDPKPFFEYLNILSRLIRQGKDQGLVREDVSPGIMKRALFGMLDELALFHVKVKSSAKYDLNAIAEEVSSFFIRGLCAKDI